MKKEAYLLKQILMSKGKEEDEMKTITTMYFSPTGTSRKISEAIADGIAGAGTFERKRIDLTKPPAREKQYEFGTEDILVLGYPVYGGRVPAVLQNVLCGLKGTATPAVLAAVYGNRDYEDALLEGQDLLAEGGFTVLAAGAFIGEHSYSAKVGAGRPDAEDLQAAESLGIKAAEKISAGDYLEVAVKGNRPYKDPMPDMPFTPKITEACTGCGLCAENCPMQVISRENPAQINTGCILCSACVKLCPQQAKYWDAEPILKIKQMLETKFVERREPEIFI